MTRNNHNIILFQHVVILAHFSEKYPNPNCTHGLRRSRGIFLVTTRPGPLDPSKYVHGWTVGALVMIFSTIIVDIL